MDNAPVPITEVTGGELQHVWKDNWNPRKLPLLPEGFSCYLSRCQRQNLFSFLCAMVQIDDASVLQYIINCKDGYFVVFPKNLAPSQQRWKKIKQRIVPSMFNVNFVYEPIQMAIPESDVEKVRDQIERDSKKWECAGRLIVDMPRCSPRELASLLWEIVSPFQR